MYRVSIELKKHEWKFGRTRNAVEHEQQASVSTAFSSSPKLPRVPLQLDRNMENMLFISFRKHCDEKKGNNLFILIIKM